MKLIKTQQFHFGATPCDVYQNSKGDFFMTRQQIGKALEYANPQQAIATLHKRYKKRMDQFSVVLDMTTTDGKNYDTILYNAKGVYEICRHSEQPKADDFYDHVYEILEGLRLGYLKIEALHQSPEWQQARLDSKATRRQETDAIKLFVEYATVQGSTHANRYYILFSILADKMANIQPKERNRATAAQLANLRLIEHIVEHTILSAMEENLYYKDVFKKVQTQLQLFTAIAYLPVVQPAKTNKAK